MLRKVPGKRRITVGGDKNYDTKDFVKSCRSMAVTPHVARRETSIVDGRTTRHSGYQVSQRIRKRVEEIFGWDKTVAGGRELSRILHFNNSIISPLRQSHLIPLIAGENRIIFLRFAQALMGQATGSGLTHPLVTATPMCFII